MLERGEKMFILLNRLLWAFAVAIVGCIATISTVIYQLNHVHKDIEYVRETAAPKYSVQVIEQLHMAETEALRECVTDPQYKPIIEAIDRKTQPILNYIVNWNTMIEPRGSVQSESQKQKMNRVNEILKTGG